ncbi:MAG: ATP-binding protein [Gammaproteobacteria bacterium]|nr:ATP-binding protein [Gammaproteobacteria bacterium]
MYQRTMLNTIKEISEVFPALLVTGPRQVGKTTLLEICATDERQYVTLDDLDIREMAQQDPGLFVQMYPPPIIIDEIQYAPQLFSYLKIVIDREKKPGMFWLTGSQKFHLMHGITETLAGRIAIVDLLGLSQAELDGRADKSSPFLPTQQWIEHNRHVKPKTIQEVFQQIWQGFFPLVNKNPQESARHFFYSSYIQTYLQRDVRSILNVSNETRFYNFLIAVAARTGQLLNYAELARDVGVDNKTVKAWLSILEASGLVYLLRPYYRNITKRLVKTPKLYFLDTGLCSYLTKWPNAESLVSGSMSGAILETYLFAEILKSYWHNGVEANFYYYRDLDQREIDLVIESGDVLYPVEFKKTATPSKTASRSFSLLTKLDKKLGDGAVMCFVNKYVPLSNNVTAIPVWYL